MIAKMKISKKFVILSSNHSKSWILIIWQNKLKEVVPPLAVYVHGFSTMRCLRRNPEVICYFWIQFHKRKECDNSFTFRIKSESNKWQLDYSLSIHNVEIHVWKEPKSVLLLKSKWAMPVSIKIVFSYWFLLLWETVLNSPISKAFTGTSKYVHSSQTVY